MHKFNAHRWLLPALIAASVSLFGCSTAATRGDNSGAPVFPDPARSTMPEGAFVNVENLRKLAPGMTKHQLFDLLGAPHFSEGVFDVPKWNYILAFRTEDGQSFKCQFQVQFDEHHLAKAYYWKPESCKSLLEIRQPAPTPTPQPQTMETISLSSDALFGFDSATLTAEGKRNLDGLLERVQAASHIQNIMITGYTDRIGSEGYNQALSRRRAEAVRDYLAAHGVAAAAMIVEGRGPADPVVQCNDKARDRLIACLAPNRRVELKGSARTSS
ncbi:OmpA family protein [Dyella sp. ASV21]|uniref:OmpA family protein n=1 Tax=Dyella sp. ASV21 TaxID=2795114 RepID=UPI0018EB0161|nr:OmpA family protein [Dyella sp. ASV21]